MVSNDILGCGLSASADVTVYNPKNTGTWLNEPTICMIIIMSQLPIYLTEFEDIFPTPNRSGKISRLVLKI